MAAGFGTLKDDIRKKIRFILRLDRALLLVWNGCRYWMLAGLLITILQGILPLAVLYLIKLLFDLLAALPAATLPHEALFSQAILLIAGAGGLALLENMLRAAASIVNRQQSELVTDYVTSMLHTRSVEADLAYYENSSYFDTLHRAQIEAPYRPVSIVEGLMGAMQNTITLAGLGGLVFLLDPLILLLLIFSVLPAFVVKILFSGKLFRQSREHTMQKRMAEYLNWLMTGDIHAKEVRLFNIGTMLKERYQALRTTLRTEKLRLAAKNSLADLAAQLPAVAMVFGTLAFITRKTVLGAITIGSMVMYYQAIQRGQAALNALFSSLASLYEDSLFLTDFYSFLELEPLVRESQNAVPFPEPLSEGISFSEVAFSYEGSSRPVLDNISFTIRPGEHIAIVGINGAGKTTLVKLLCRLYDPTAGSITVDGVDLRSIGTASLRSNISVLLQDYAKYQVSVRENIWFGNTLLPSDHQTLRQSATWSGADVMIGSLPEGYETRLGRMFENGTELSIGQWQKIALARAFFRQASVIVLDEPTSSLDIESEYEVFRQFHQLTRGKTAIIISHRLSTVRMADRILVIDQGTIAESGTHRELIEKQGIYARLYELQAGQYAHP